MLIEFLQPDFVFENENGSLKQLVHDGYKQVNVSLSMAGTRRGGHYHKYNREIFYCISGSFTLEVSRQETVETYEIKAGDFFLIPPYVKHLFTYRSDTVMVAMYDKGVELGAQKDIWTE